MWFKLWWSCKNQHNLRHFCYIKYGRPFTNYNYLWTIKIMTVYCTPFLINPIYKFDVYLYCEWLFQNDNMCHILFCVVFVFIDLVICERVVRLITIVFVLHIVSCVQVKTVDCWRTYCLVLKINPLHFVFTIKIIKIVFNFNTMSDCIAFFKYNYYISD